MKYISYNIEHKEYQELDSDVVTLEILNEWNRQCELSGGTHKFFIPEELNSQVLNLLPEPNKLYLLKCDLKKYEILRDRDDMCRYRNILERNMLTDCINSVKKQIKELEENER